MRLVAASCANLRDVPHQPVWAAIQAERPDVLLLLGDNVYLARDDHDDPAALGAELRSLYAQQQAQPEFAALLAELKTRGGHCIAIYDDHDFLGNNRCGADHPLALRQAARQAFIEAWSPVQTGDEVYRVQHLGRLDVVVLDERFHRASPSAAAANDVDAILGATQWRWLEAVVAACAAPYLVLASSTTFHCFGDQSWEQYPAAFQRLRRLLRGRAGAMVLSGDVHRNAAFDDSGVIEIVSSGVAQRSQTFGTVRHNFVVLNFEPDGVDVRLRSLKVGSRFAFQIPFASWALP